MKRWVPIFAALPIVLSSYLFTTILSGYLFTNNITPVAKTDNPIKVMPLGDSITLGIGDGTVNNDGYRCALKIRLRNNNLPIDYVGSQSSGPANCVDIQHEGHSGYTIAQLNSGVYNWVSIYQPDVIILMVGTNDIKLKLDMDHMADRLSTLLDTIQSAKPDAILVVSTIIQFKTTDQSQIDGWNSYATQIPIVADEHGAFVAYNNGIIASSLPDGIHPSQCVYDNQMAMNMFFAMIQVYPHRTYSPLPVPKRC